MGPTDLKQGFRDSGKAGSKASTAVDIDGWLSDGARQKKARELAGLSHTQEGRNAGAFAPVP